MPVTMLLVQVALLARLAAPTVYPFRVGETLQYDAKLGMLPIGSATMTVNPMTRERGREAFVFAATGEGRPLGLRVGAELTSYVGATGFNSLRFHRRVFQGASVDESQFQIVPDSSRYREEGIPQDWASPRDPLDELAFLYYLRTVPLKVGATYQIPRYFKTGYNPVQVTVAGRETQQLPDGRSAPVLQLEITTRTLRIDVKMTDDAKRLPVEMEIPLPFGRVTLELTRAG
ncbi:MAG TPA: DUF3108 domain-containing protein [Gemmatimonadales bacterium]|nr:DUF3108 domain-containing protein [Gemmatimonadales bacterium]